MIRQDSTGLDAEDCTILGKALQSVAVPRQCKSGNQSHAIDPARGRHGVRCEQLMHRPAELDGIPEMRRVYESPGNGCQPLGIARRAGLDTRDPGENVNPDRGSQGIVRCEASFALVVCLRTREPGGFEKDRRTFCNVGGAWQAHISTLC